MRQKNWFQKKRSVNMSNHPLNNRGWSSVRDLLICVLLKADKYLDLKIKEAESKKE